MGNMYVARLCCLSRPYLIEDVIQSIIKYARGYFIQERNTIKEAVVNELVNWIATVNDIKFEVYTTDIYDKKDVDMDIAPEEICSILKSYLPYIREIIQKQVLTHKYRHNCYDMVTNEEAAFILDEFVDFVDVGPKPPCKKKTPK